MSDFSAAGSRRLTEQGVGDADLLVQLARAESPSIAPVPAGGVSTCSAKPSLRSASGQARSWLGRRRPSARVPARTPARRSLSAPHRASGHGLAARDARAHARARRRRPPLRAWRLRHEGRPRPDGLRASPRLELGLSATVTPVVFVASDGQQPRLRTPSPPACPRGRTGVSSSSPASVTMRKLKTEPGKERASSWRSAGKHRMPGSARARSARSSRLSYQIQRLFALNDPDRGVTVSIGADRRRTAPERSGADRQRQGRRAGAHRRGMPGGSRPRSARSSVRGGCRPPGPGTFQAAPRWRTAVTRPLAAAKRVRASSGSPSTRRRVGRRLGRERHQPHPATLDGLGPVGDQELTPSTSTSRSPRLRGGRPARAPAPGADRNSPSRRTPVAQAVVASWRAMPLPASRVARMEQRQFAVEPSANSWSMGDYRRWPGARAARGIEAQGWILAVAAGDLVVGAPRMPCGDAPGYRRLARDRG